jgi:Collagen triple helix repeat (20 copies)
MKTLLVMSAFLLVLPIAGCTVSPTPTVTQGPAGPQGQSGQTGQTGQAGQTGDPGQSGQQGATGQAGDQGQTGQTGRQGREGQEAPCPAGEHRYTNPDTGKVSCVKD